jgi:Tol biopolymer transport system component/subtilisin family serine protease
MEEQSMIRQGLIKFIGILCVLSLLLTGLVQTVPVYAGDDVQPATKISSLLSMHIKIKTEQLDNPNQAFSQSAGDTTSISSERVFLHFAEQPTATQIDELCSLGVTINPESWIPPVNSFTTGFVLADMPLDKLDSLAAKSYIVSLDTAEQTLSPQNDQAREVMNVDPVWSGGATGVGVTVAVIDSGIDTSNPDFPALNSSNSKDYSNYPVLDDTITNTVTGHGTSVTGSLLGRGANSPTYAGVAPGASLVFLKVGKDTNGSAPSAAIVYALRDAVDIYNAKIINLSLGSWSEHHDGSDAVCQAVDYATSKGTTVFVAAGNDANRGWHYSGTVNANSLSSYIPLTVTSGTSYSEMNLVWDDGLGTHNGLNIKYYDSNHNLLDSFNSNQSESNKSGVESILSQLNTAIPSGTYYIKVQNSSSKQQFFHIYYMGSYLGETSTTTFSSPDPNYTIGSPAESDSAIAIGAYVTRYNWVNYQGLTYYYPDQTIGQIATYSSRGPRVDSGAPDKPDIVAPGTAIISSRDPIYTTGSSDYRPLIIDNDGKNLNGSGPANYFVSAGTSMACPMAAGVGALILSKNPSFTPQDVKMALLITTTDKGSTGYDNIYGWGLINADSAVNYSKYPIVKTYPTIDISNTGATLKGALTSKGNAETILVSFEYGLTDSYGINAEVNPPSLSNPGLFSASVSGLITGRTYHYRAKADAGTAGIFFSEDRTFIAGNTGKQGKIVFSSERDGSYPEIYSMNADGTNQIRLTNSAGYDYQPAYSPDGTKIAFVSGRDGRSNIYVMNADGSNQVRLTTSSGDWCPTWSPDGSQIAFFSGRTNTSQIYIMDSDGNNQRQMTNSGANVTPDWSNSNKILYLAGNDDLSGIYTMDPDGTHKTRITSGINQEHNPKWSPDGTKILYVNSQDEIYSMNADGTVKIRLKRSLSDSPQWSPDGDKIVFAYNFSGNWEICLMESDGKNPIQLTSAQHTDNQPDWTSPIITTLNASAVTRTSATLNGNITCLGGATYINVCFEYGTTLEYGKSTELQELTTSGNFTANITDLIPGTTYYCRVKAVGDGTVYGNDVSFTNPGEPTINSFTPKIGGNGTSVIISGNSFTTAVAVNIGGTPASSFTVDSNTQITAVSGNGSTGKISVTNPDGVAVSADNFTYYEAPTINSFTPNMGVTGTSVIISGTNFEGATAVSIGGTAAFSYIVNSSTQITAVVGGGSTGTVFVTTPGGTATSSGSFTYYASPTIGTFTPNLGGPGTSVIITGTNFEGSTAISIGGTAASGYIVDSATQITAVVGDGSSGTISVTTPGGTAISAASFTYYILPSVATESLPPGEIKGNYGPVTLEVTGGIAPYKWAKIGTWPSGLKISKDGVISGKPSVKITEPTDYTITVTVTDSFSSAGTRSSSASEMTINQVQINTQNWQDRQIISPNDQNTIEDENSQYVEETGNITEGASSNNIATKSFNITIYPELKNVKPGTTSALSQLPPADAGSPFSYTCNPLGGDESYTWSLGSDTSGCLSIDNVTGVLSGTPITNGSYKVNIVLTDGLGYWVSKNLSWKVNKALTITTASLPSGDMGVKYKKTTLKATGGKTPYSWSITEGGLPDGLTMTSKGVISGTPTAGSSDNYSITFEVSDGIATTSSTLSIIIYPELAIGDLPDGTVGIDYSQDLSAVTTGGSGVYKFSIKGTLPTGLKFSSSTGIISGTPTTAGTYNFDLKVTDSLKGTITQSVSIIVN